MKLYLEEKKQPMSLRIMRIKRQKMKNHGPKRKRKKKQRIKRIFFSEIKIKRNSETNTTLETFRSRFHCYLT